MAKKILIVEDTQTIVMVMKMMLSGRGYKLETASNGEEGLAKVRSFGPDLVLADIVMPKMDGIEMCRQIKQDAEIQHIPVVMVTTKGEPEQVEKAFLAGCSDYTTKPINKLELIEKIDNNIL